MDSTAARPADITWGRWLVVFKFEDDESPFCGFYPVTDLRNEGGFARGKGLAID